MGRLKNRRIWLVLNMCEYAIPWYWVVPTTEYRYETDAYIQGLLEQCESEVYYSPMLLQKRIDELENEGIKVRICKDLW